MKKIVFYSLFLLLSFQLIAQTTVNQIDSNGKRQGVWKKKYQNGNLRYTGQFSHGKEVGTFKFYNISGEKHPMVIKKFNPDNDLATVTFYTKKGKIESTGQMIGKTRIGKWVYYFSDGKTVLSVENYKNGLLDGEYKVFYKSGQLTELSHYKNGKKDGISLRYSDEGVLTENITYKDGIANGYAIIYDEHGDVFARGNYVNGIKKGIWEFNMDGEMVKFDPSKKTPKNR